MRVVATLPKTPILVTCRVKDYDNIIEKGGEKIALNGAVTLKPLTDAQIEGHLHDQPELLASLKSDERLLEMARTPLLLTLLTVAYRGAGERARELSNLEGGLPELQDKIFETYVHKRYQFEQARSKAPLPFTLEQIYDVMGQVTIRMLGDPDRMMLIQTRRNTLEIEASSLRRILGQQATSFIELVQRLHLLLTVREGYFRFIHLLLRDHFALFYCLSSLRNKTTTNQIRIQAALTLGEIGSLKAVDPLIELLQDKTEVDTLRQIVAMALGRIGNPNSIVPLLELLRDESQIVRYGAHVAFAFGNLDISQIKEFTPFMDSLSDSDSDIYICAVIALGRIGVEAIDSLITILRDKNRQNIHHLVVVALGRMGKIAADKVLNAFRMIYPTERFMALQALIQSDDPFDWLAVAAAGDDRDPIVGAYALGAVLEGKLLPVDILINGLSHVKSGVRMIAAGMLAFYGDIHSVTALIQILQDVNPTVRNAAVSTLGELGDSRAIEPLKALLNDPEEKVRKDTRNSLKKLGYDPESPESEDAES